MILSAYTNIYSHHTVTTSCSTLAIDVKLSHLPGQVSLLASATTAATLSVRKIARLTCIAGSSAVRVGDVDCGQVQENLALEPGLHDAGHGEVRQHVVWCLMDVVLGLGCTILLRRWLGKRLA